MIRRLPRWAWALAPLVVLVGAVVAALVLLGPRERLDLFAAAGRLHPGFVHLPIGALVAAAVLVVLARSGRLPAARAAVTPVLLLAAAGGAAAAAAGQGLASDGSYAGDTFEWHRRLGYAVAVLASLAAGLSWWAAAPGVRRTAQLTLASDSLLGAGLLLLVITGHLGGSLTHGEDYLTERLPPSLTAWFGSSAPATTGRKVQPSQVVVYEALVAPILQQHCNDCHGPNKASGDLRLDTPAHIAAGGRTGAAFVAGQAGASDMIQRIWLPPSHQDVMPPRERPAMPVADATVLRWWVDQGASFEHSLADVELHPDVTPSIQARVGDLALDGPTLLTVDPGPLDAAAITALRAQGLPVSRLAEGVDWLQVEARGAGQAFDDRRLGQLLPVAPHVTWMDLGGTAVTPAGLAQLGTFPHLTRLHLDRTQASDAVVDVLMALPHLETLNLYDTQITDAGLQRLATLTSLRSLYVARTAVTPAGASAARGARPDLTLYADLGAPAAAAPPADAPATRPAPSR